MSPDEDPWTIRFGFVDLANRHMQRVMLTRHSRTVGWRFP